MNSEVTWTVPQVNDLAAASIEATFADAIWVEGEVVNLTKARSGHVYFQMTEPGPEGRKGPQLSVTLFDWYRQKVNLQIRQAGGNIRMENGVKIRIRGTVELYQARGQLQLKMFAIDPAYTLGTLAAERAALLAALADAGLLDRNAGVPLPIMPLRVGLVTALGSAAHADFRDELDQSGVGFHLIEVDAPTQGDGAAPRLAAAVTTLVAHGVDVICVVRGGGARTDLAAFDDEVLARTVALCPVPVWTGVGHEIDRTVIDDVAHQAHKTPTACAAALVGVVRQQAAAADDLSVQIAHAVRHRIDRAEQRVRDLSHHTARAAHSRIERADRRMHLSAAQVVSASRRHVDRADHHLVRSAATVASVAPRRWRDAQTALDAIATQVRALDPARILDRGWTQTRRADGTLVRSAADVSPGDELITRFADGTARSTAQSVEHSDV